MTDYLADLDRGLSHFSSTRAEYARREAYQEGTISEAFGSAKLRRALKLTMDRYKLNFAACATDSLVRRVKVSSMTTKTPAISTLLDDLVDANELEEDLDIWIKKAAYFGDYYVLVEPDDEDGVDVIGKDPLSTAILYSTSNSRKPAFGLQKWKVGKRVRVNLYYDDETYQMISKVGTTGAKSKDYEPLSEVDDDPTSPTFGDVLDPSILNEWGFPLFHLRVDGKPYGEPVHGKAFGAQDAITKLVGTHMGSVDFLGYPQRYAIAELASDQDGGGEDFGDGEIEQDDATTGKTKLASGPGEVWWLEGVKAVGQFATAEAKSFIEPIVFYIRAMSKTTDTPLYEFDLDGAEPSGEARRRADGPINNHADGLKRSFSVSISSFLEYALDVLGHADQKVEVAWKPAEIVTDKEGWETLELKVKNGIPLRQALMEAGYSADQIEEWYPEADGPAVSVALGAALAEVLASIGKASAAGIAGSAEALAWFPEFITPGAKEAVPVAPIFATPIPPVVAPGAPIPA